MSDRWWYEINLLGPRNDDIWDIVEEAVKPLGYTSEGGHGCREEHLDEVAAGRRAAVDKPSYDAGWTAGYEKAVDNARHATEPDGDAAPTALTAPPATECASETIAAQRRDLAKAQTEHGSGWNLQQRIDAWAWERNGSRFEWGFDHEATHRPLKAQLRKHDSPDPWAVGYGDTSNEALNALADGLVEDGWPDDRDGRTTNQ